MRKLTFWIWMVGWLLVSTGARAALLEWQLRGASFDDGGTASGHFTFDTMLNAVIDFDITTTVGAQINSQFRYTLSSARITSQANNPSQGDHFFKLDSSEGSVSGGTRELFLAFASPLIEGTPVSILYQGGPGNISYESLLAGEHGWGARVVVGPEVRNTATVPEPTASTCLGLGLAAFGCISFLRSRYQERHLTSAR